MSDNGQLSLTMEWVDLTDDERMERGQQLAHMIRERAVMALDHTERKADMKKEREDVEAKIALLAEIIRVGKEERPRAVERE